MENKDKILEDLKDRTLSSYEFADITDIRILVNPKTMDYIIDRSQQW